MFRNSASYKRFRGNTEKRTKWIGEKKGTERKRASRIWEKRMVIDIIKIIRENNWTSGCRISSRGRKLLTVEVINQGSRKRTRQSRERSRQRGC